MEQAIIIAFVENYETSGRLIRLSHELVSKGAVLICADSGGDVARSWSLKPDLLLGDMDSITPTTLSYFEGEGIQIQKFPVAKDETDLELAILAAIKLGCKHINILGGLGGRLDQTLANLFLLAQPNLKQNDIQVVINAEDEDIWLLQNGGDIEFEGDVGATVSVIALSNVAENISTTNLRYPLINESLFLGSTRGISNVIADTPARISFTKGSLIVIHRHI